MDLNMFNICYNVVLQFTMIVGIMIRWIHIICPLKYIALAFDRNYKLFILIKEKAGTPRLFIRSGFSSQLLYNYWLTNNSQRMYEIL